MPASGRRRVGLAVGLVTVAAAIAVVMAASGDDGSSANSAANAADLYARKANRICMTAAGKLERLERRWQRSPSPDGNPGPLARAMFTLVGDERERLAALSAPPGGAVGTVELDQALLEFENRLTDVIHLGSFDRAHVAPVAKAADAAGSAADQTASRLGLDRCAALPLAVSPSLGLG